MKIYKEVKIKLKIYLIVEEHYTQVYNFFRGLNR